MISSKHCASASAARAPRRLIISLSYCLIFSLSLSAAPAAETDRYGGFMGVVREASGFFRVEQIGERWFFITPDGHPYIALGGNHVGAYLKSQAQEAGLLARHGGDVGRAAEAVLAEIRALGLNAGDAYQPVPQFAERLPWIKPFHYLPAPKQGWPDVFDAVEMRAMHEHVKTQCAAIAGQPWVIGVAGPDLPPWDSSFVRRYRLNPVGSPGRQGYLAFLKERHQEDIASVNAAYGTRFDSWAALEAKPRLDLKIETDAARADDAAFLALIAERHFAAVRAACKAGAPHHLYLGERTQLRVIPDGVLRAMGRHIDVFCTQSLIRLPKDPPEWQVFQRQHYDREFALVGKPMIIVDWAAPFSPHSGEMQTEYGTLKPEAAAAQEAGQFVRDAFQPPYMTGLFICQVLGTHANDRWFGPQARRTYLRDDGTPLPERSRQIARANHEVLARLYEQEASDAAKPGTLPSSSSGPPQKQEHTLISAAQGDERRYLAFPVLLDLGEEILIAYKRGKTHGRDLGSQLELARLNPATGLISSRSTLYSNPAHIAMSGEWVRFPNGHIANYIDVQHNVKGAERVGMHVVRSEDGGRTFSQPQRVGPVEGREYGYAFDAISEGGITWMLAMTWQYLNRGEKQPAAGEPRRAVHVIRSADNGHTWSFVRDLSREFGGLSINESAFLRLDDGFLICSRGYDDRARLHLVDKNFALLRQSDLTEQHDFIAGYIGRPRLFQREGRTYLLGRNWTHTSERPDKPGPPGVAGHRSGQQLSLFQIDVSTLSVARHTLLDNVERKDVTDGYYAMPYFRTISGAEQVHFITYRAHAHADPTIIDLQFRWEELK